MNREQTEAGVLAAPDLKGEPLDLPDQSPGDNIEALRLR